MRTGIGRAAIKVGVGADIVPTIEAGVYILVILRGIGGVEAEAASRKEVQRVLSPLRAQLQARVHDLDKAPDDLG